jgi:ketosteroid isomerase-like protein
VSRENVEFMETLLTGVAGLDRQALLAGAPELIAQVADPDVEWVEERQNVEGQVYRGHEGMLQSLERWLEQWDEFEYAAERFVDCGDEVLVVGRERGRGVASGATVTSRIYSVWTIRAGKILRYREFYDEHEAFKAVGLEE